MTTTRTIKAACVVAAFSAATFAAPKPYVIGPPGAWVTLAPDALVTDETAPVEAGESDFLIAEHQVRISKSTLHYQRYAERMVHQAAVDAGGQVSISIDPVHEKIELHQVRVIRGGRFLDKLADARLSLLNREEELEDGLINGRVTLHVLLNDLRLGDVLDYSFTTERTEPIEERGYHSWFSTQWATPVRYFRLRVLHPPERMLHVKDLGELPPARHARAGAWHEITWEARDVAPKPAVSELPSWYFAYPRIEISEFASWNAVRDWAMPLYAVPARKRADVDALLERLRAEPDDASRVLRALRFVQDDIRYTGIEIGAGAWRPTQPEVVLERRFGDCKDKTLLLVTVLRALGIEAAPALVHTSNGRGMRERLPSPGAFDHVIARVRLGERVYWLDGTVSGQGGDLDTLVQADFGPALVLAPGTDSLEDMPVRPAAEPTSHVVETFDLSAGVEKSAPLTVLTLHRGADADSMRVRMRTRTAAETGKQYLDYYRKSYAGIRMAKPLEIEDDRQKNVITVRESYLIDKPFVKDAKEGSRKFYLEAYSITAQTGKPDEAVRTVPLARRFPLHVRHEIVAQLAGRWDIESDGVEIADPAFQYRSSVSFRDGKLALDYSLRNTRDHVAVPELEQFLMKLDQARDDAFYTLTDGDANDAASVGKGPSWKLIATLIVGLTLGVFAILWARTRTWRLPDAAPGEPAGLGGWMVFPTIGVLASVVVMGTEVFGWFSDLGSAESVNRLAVPSQVLLLLEFLVLSMTLAISFYLIWLLFARERKFPFVFIGVQMLYVVQLFLDLCALWSLGYSGTPETSHAAKELAVRAVVGGLWCVYMLNAKRVRATFVRTRGVDDPPALPQPAVQRA